MSPNRIETAEDLERIVAAQTTAIDALDKLVRAMDERIRLQQELIDGHQEIFIRLGYAKPRPKPLPAGGSLAN
jgi:hypothetical protein